MAAYTVLNSEEINSIIANYAIGGVISYKILSGGSENTNYLIQTDNHSYVLTICEQKSILETTNLAMLLAHLEANDFLTSIPIKTKEKTLVSSYKEKPVLLKTFIEGQIMDDLPNHLLTLIGKQLGKLHKIKAPEYLPRTINYGKEHFVDVGIYAPNSHFHLWLREIGAYIAPYMVLNLPKSLVHSDVFFSNVIVDNTENSIAIMDFEEATCYFRVFDIGMTIVGLCSQNETIDPKKVKTLLKGYLQEVSLTELEKESLQVFTIYAAASMCFWRHKNFNYTNPTPELKDHYLELKNIADFVKNLPHDCFKELMTQL